MSDSEAIRFIIVDDHDIVREGLAVLLTAFSDLDLVGHAGSSSEALALCERTRPDVILMDLVMPEIDGITAIKRIRERLPDSKILAFSSFGDKERVNAALQAGATSYLLKNVSAFELAQAIRMTKAGISAFAPEVASILTEGQEEKMPEDALGLTSRELEVLNLLVNGTTNHEIAVNLGISKYTVKNHVSSILSKLGAASRTEAVSLALRQGVVRKEERPENRL